MILSSFAPLIMPAYVQSLFAHHSVWECFMMTHECFLLDNFKTNSFNTRICPCEIAVDNNLLYPNRLKDLCSTIRFDSRYAHLRHNFNDTFGGRFDVPLHSVLVSNICELSFLDHISQTLECHVWVHRLNAVAQKQTEMMNFSGLSRLECYPDLGPSSLPD